MKVLIINSVCGFGSTGRIAVDEYKELIKRGNDCIIAYGRGQASSHVKTYKIGNEFDVRLHGILSRITDKQGLYSKRVTKKFVAFIKEYAPDVIHLHNIHGYYLNYEILFNFLRQSNIRVVWTLHDCWSFTGHCAHYESIGCNQWINGCYCCNGKDMYPRSYVLSSCKENYNLKKRLFTNMPNMELIVPSNWLCNQVKKSFLKEYKVHVIHTGIDLDVFKPTKSNLREKYGIANKKVILGVASIWTDKKGFSDFIKLNEMLNHDKYQVVMIGINKKQKRKLSNTILAIERTNNQKELAQFYSMADVFFNPTYEDTFPTTNLESIACGTPVVTYDTGGSPEVISEGNGNVVGTIENVYKTLIDGTYVLSNDKIVINEMFGYNFFLNRYMEVILNDIV